MYRWLVADVATPDLVPFLPFAVFREPRGASRSLSSSTWTSVRGREILHFGVGVTLGFVRIFAIRSLYVISVDLRRCNKI